MGLNVIVSGLQDIVAYSYTAYDMRNIKEYKKRKEEGEEEEEEEEEERQEDKDEEVACRMVELLLEGGAEVNQRGSGGNTALHAALNLGMAPLVSPAAEG
ncbi:hypothetical protein E2C01_088043 [Portunus trituberculatus]|uniref:Uncharacterized protein n=1 Tax=Portunus trituberculatus TaxID=210409 RepID=A0A5B7J855_PORTR|nr:hypothetical protein [Portunus trituberculatus]